jgi:signal transduction histidine kinase
MVPERDERGKLRRTLVALTDITAHKQAEAALRASEDRLRHAQKLEAVGQLTGGIAHDFNNLLTSVMGSLDLLRRRVLLDERGHRLVGNALEGAKRAAALTSQLLTFSRKQHLSPEVLLPLRVVEGIFDLLARSLDERITLVVVPGPPAEWAVLADRNQLEAALLNLVINARDSISAFGEIRISVADRALTQAELDRLSEETLPAGEYVAIEVADTGCGMTEDVRRRAVEPFFTTKPLGAGTGLGLSQSYGFVTQSGGALAIDSAVGAGTRITILLPRTQLPLPEAANEAPAARAERAHGNGECILVVRTMCCCAGR